jgi:class 3 adenylate cyclase
VVTVVFVDLAGSTELAARLDPERFREVLAAFHGMVTDEITALGGRAEGFIGDAVLGVFGVPYSMTTTRCAAFVRAWRSWTGPSGSGRAWVSMPVQVRVGVNTGQVAVGTAMDRNIVIGAEVNIGARIQQAAEPGEVLVGASTKQLVGNGVVFGQVRSVQAKGIDGALATWPALSLAGPPTRRSLHLVNRRRELALLSDTFERAKVRERAHLVTLLGEPGIGKTRVVEAFLGSLDDDVKVLTGRSTRSKKR